MRRCRHCIFLIKSVLLRNGLNWNSIFGLTLNLIDRPSMLEIDENGIQVSDDDYCLAKTCVYHHIGCETMDFEKIKPMKCTQCDVRFHAYYTNNRLHPVLLKTCTPTFRAKEVAWLTVCQTHILSSPTNYFHFGCYFDTDFYC